MRSLRRVLAGILIAAAALILPMAGMSQAISLTDCMQGGGKMAVGTGHYYCKGGKLDDAIIG